MRPERESLTFPQLWPYILTTGIFNGKPTVLSNPPTPFTNQVSNGGVGWVSFVDSNWQCLLHCQFAPSVSNWYGLFVEDGVVLKRKEKKKKRNAALNMSLMVAKRGPACIMWSDQPRSCLWPLASHHLPCFYPTYAISFLLDGQIEVAIRSGCTKWVRQA